MVAEEHRHPEQLRVHEIAMLAEVLGFPDAIDLANFAQAVEQKSQFDEASPPAVAQEYPEGAASTDRRLRSPRPRPVPGQRSAVYPSRRKHPTAPPFGTLKNEEAVMRVEVDRDRCEGNALCVGIAPNLFDLDDNELAVVLSDPVPAGEEDLAEQSIVECPRAAVTRKQ